MRGELIGSIDLLLKDQSGRDIILDVKWGGGKYREDELRQNIHLQLAVYAWMRKCMTRSAQWPPQAFFIVDDARFLAQDQATFPSATPCPNRDGETTADLWRRFEVTWNWRRDQLDRGLIEMTIEGAEPDEDSEAPEDGMKLEDHADRFNDYLRLDGLGGGRMTTNIRFISAGAGSGKTFRLTEELEKALVEGRAKPEGVIGTTFTKKAANELRERVRQRLIQSGRNALANQMGQALLGTVNSVCGRLLGRFAFEAGLPPELEVVPEEDAQLMFNRAVDDAVSALDVRRMNELSERMGIQDKRYKKDWRNDLSLIASTARANDMQLEDLAAWGQTQRERPDWPFPPNGQREICGTRWGGLSAGRFAGSGPMVMPQRALRNIFGCCRGFSKPSTKNGWPGVIGSS